MDSKNIAVIGSGSWGIAISNILAENGHIVNVWSFSEDEKNEINNEHKTRFIPDLELNENVMSYRLDDALDRIDKKKNGIHQIRFLYSLEDIINNARRNGFRR